MSHEQTETESMHLWLGRCAVPYRVDGVLRDGHLRRSGVLLFQHASEVSKGGQRDEEVEQGTLNSRIKNGAVSADMSRRSTAILARFTRMESVDRSRKRVCHDVKSHYRTNASAISFALSILETLQHLPAFPLPPPDKLPRRARRSPA
jgi:hypothetical protein